MHQPPRAPTQNILLLLIAYRLVNAFAVRTFFQPDEYFQSLEPAWKIAFGEDQGAWITWVSECDRIQNVWEPNLSSASRNGETNYDLHYTLYSLLPFTKLRTTSQRFFTFLLQRVRSS
jgi:hypothetical protein